MTHTLVSILWFVAPLWAVNVSLNALGYVSMRFPLIRQFDRAIDGKKYFFDGRRVLGDSTTVLGLVVCVMIGAVAAYAGETWYLVVPLLVYGGHACGSFVKRRFGYTDGTYLPFVDHLDYVVLPGVFAVLFEYVSLATILGALVLTFFITPLVTIFAYALSFRQRPL